MVARGRGVAEPRLSPEGERVAFVSSAGGRGSLVVVPAGGGAEVAVAADPPVASYGAFDWCPDGASLVYVGAKGGLFVVGAEGGPSRAVVPEGRVAAPAVSPDGTRVAYALDVGGRSFVAVAPLAPDGPWPVRLSGAVAAPGGGGDEDGGVGPPDFCLDPAWSPDGRAVAWHEWRVPAMPWDESRIASAPADGSAGPAFVAGGEGVAVAQPRFSPDGSALAFLCDAEGFLNVWVAGPDGSGARNLRPEPFEHGDPTWGPGARSYCWSPDGAFVAFSRNEAGFGRLCAVRVADGEVFALGKGVHSALSWSRDGRLAAVRSGARTPTQVVVLHPRPGGAGGPAGSPERVPVLPAAVPPPASALDAAVPLTRLPTVRTTVARGPVGGFEAALVEPEAVEWVGPSTEAGDVVRGRLYRPAAPAGGLERPPLLVWVHGGPTGQWPVAFLPRVAYFVERGWAVLVPDHRGSTGWGRAYAQALRGRWGELDVADCAAGMRAAAERGWCDPRRMAPIGGSSGGFTVLNLLASHPELCAAGVDAYGVADLFDLAETTHRYEAHYLDSIVGPLPEAAERYRSRSPVNRVERIEAPLLVLQGTSDEVVPAAQSEAVAGRLSALGRTVELHLYEGEGHGWGRPETVEDELARTEAFLARHVLRRRA